MALERNGLSTAPKIRRLSEMGNARQGFFEQEDFEAVVCFLPEDLRDFARFSYLSGWRKGEIRSLKWADVDMSGAVLRLRPESSKNGHGRMLILEGEIHEIIKRRNANQACRQKDGTLAFSLYVFHRTGEPIGDIRKVWTTACNRAGVKGKLFHDLRRTAVRNMIRAGVPERVAMEISGHKTRAIFDRYNIVSEDDLRNAMRRTQEFLRSVTIERKVENLPQEKEGAKR